MAIKGITVTLINFEDGDLDEFGRPDRVEKTTEVKNVLVSPTSSAANVDNMQLYGRMAAYTLAIPKDDTNDWENAAVEFFGKRWRTLGLPIKGIEADIPLSWNTKVQVERYE